MPEVVAQAAPESSYRGDAEENLHQSQVPPRNVICSPEPPFAVEDHARDCFFELARVAYAPVQLGARGFDRRVTLQ